AVRRHATPTIPRSCVRSASGGCRRSSSATRSAASLRRKARTCSCYRTRTAGRASCALRAPLSWRAAVASRRRISCRCRRRSRGAAVVIATIATVIGEHAARTAVLLTDALVPQDGATPQRLGEAMRAVKRQALLEGLLMPLCLVAYGDADWSLAR